MTVLGRILDRRTSIENPLHALTGKTLAQFLDGASSAGVTVTETTAMRHVAVYRCVELISGTCAALPLKAYRKSADGGRVEVESPVLADPHPELTKFEVWESSYTCLLLWGNAYFRKMRDGAGRVQQLWPIHPSRVRVDLVDPSDGNPGGKIFAITDKSGRYQPYTSWEILHIPGLGYDGRVGMSRIRMAARAIGVGLAADEYASKFFANGSLFSGILSTEKSLQEPAADALKARWRAKVGGGIENAHDIAVLDNGAKFQPVSIPPEDAQLLESRGWSTTEVARLFGLPPHAIGDVAKSTSWGTGIEQQTIGMVQFTLAPTYLTRVEQRLTKEVLRDQDVYAEYLVDGLLRGDSAARGEFYAKGITNGFLTRNGVREKENEPPIDGGDEMLLPAGVLPAGVSETKAKVEAVGALVRAGFNPAAACAAVGLDPIAHTGLVPVTVQGEELAEGGTQ